RRRGRGRRPGPGRGSHPTTSAGRPPPVTAPGPRLAELLERVAKERYCGHLVEQALEVGVTRTAHHNRDRGP
ncbi:MAG TPA: hypothetical protein VFX88_22615, partial [Actinomycetota bacterium]|nr:hypothetical protein [Actinomycetota bacterium]